MLRCRLEDVLAACVSLALVLLCVTTRLIHSFQVGFLDVVFILLPVGVLGVKTLLGMLSSGTNDEQDSDPTKFVFSFFRPLAKIMRDWFPFVLLTACYYSLFGNLILRINPNLADPTLSKIDAAIFGTQPSFLLEPFIRPGITDFFSIIYFSHVIVFPGAALYFYVKGEEKPFRRIMMGLLTIMLMGFTSYALVPAVGPESYFASHYTHDLSGQSISRGVDYIIQKGRVSFDCFPSLHVGIPLLLTFYIRQYRPKWFIPMALYVACMCCATIYLRYHYVIDVIASFAFAPAAYFLNDFALSRWPGEKIAVQSVKNKEKVPGAGQGVPGPLEPLS
ncbi:MAG TPA: phosphatase PAP2 family protein [Alphaproteobacteria bacterium]|nr:phosphatase PAP2 family protein [Alphaproteobacteria bacterium]